MIRTIKVNYEKSQTVKRNQEKLFGVKNKIYFSVCKGKEIRIIQQDHILGSINALAIFKKNILNLLCLLIY